MPNPYAPVLERIQHYALSTDYVVRGDNWPDGGARLAACEVTLMLAQGCFEAGDTLERGGKTYRTKGRELEEVKR